MIQLFIHYLLQSNKYNISMYLSPHYCLYLNFILSINLHLFHSWLYSLSSTLMFYIHFFKSFLFYSHITVSQAVLVVFTSEIAVAKKIELSLASQFKSFYCKWASSQSRKLALLDIYLKVLFPFEGMGVLAICDSYYYKTVSNYDVKFES